MMPFSIDIPATPINAFEMLSFFNASSVILPTIESLVFRRTPPVSMTVIDLFACNTWAILKAYVTTVRGASHSKSFVAMLIQVVPASKKMLSLNSTYSNAFFAIRFFSSISISDLFT